MAFIQCECGSKMDLSTSAIRVTCTGCGKRFTVPQIDEPAAELAVADSQPAAAQPREMSATMMQDLPVVTQFENHYAQSILAVGMFNSQVGSSSVGDAMNAAAGVAPMVAGAVAAAAAGLSTFRTPAGNRSTHKSKRRSQPSSPSGLQDVQLQPGQILLERYEVGRKIGQGGMSSVYEACDHVRGEQVALKILLPHLAAKPKLQERFLQEGRLSSNFSHPNIARVYDLHQTDSHILLSMELLHGSTLRHDMHRRKTQGQSYRPAEVVSILRQVCDALAVVHSAGIVHRDLKPENLWLGLDGTVKVMDFGIARDAVRGAHTTGPRGSGTPYYIAPEQLSASPTLDHRADQYSLAIIAYELLTGELPQGAVVPPHVKHPSIPKKLSLAIFRGLSADPGQRYADIGRFQAALDYQRRMPLLAKLVMGAAAVSALGASGFAFERYALPLFETQVSPVWAEVATQKVVEGDTVSFTVRHPECTLTGKSLQYKLLSDAPVGARIDSSTGKFEWTPSEVQGPKDYTFNIMAVVEEEGRPPVIEERPVSISVKEAFNSPIFETPESFTAKENAPLETAIVATDPNEPKVGLVYELVDPPAGMTIDERTGVIQWTPREDMGSTHHSVPVRVALAGDEHRDITTVRKLNIHIEEAIDKLVFTSPERFSAEVNVPLKHRIMTRDPNTPTLNTYYRLKGGDRLGMVLEPQSGELQWTPSEDASGKNFDVIVEACWDGAGKTEVVGSQMLKFTVAEYAPPTVEEAPKVEPTADPLPPTPPVVVSAGDFGIGAGLGGGAAVGGGNCPTGGGAGANGGQGNGGGNCPNAGGSGGGGQGNCPTGNNPIGNGPIGGIIVDIVGAAVAARKQQEAGGNTAPVNNNNEAPNSANSGAANGSGNGKPGGSVGNNPPFPGRLPIGNLPIGNLPINKLPINRLPVHPVPTFPQQRPQSRVTPRFPNRNNSIPSKVTVPQARGNTASQGSGNSFKQKVQQELQRRGAGANAPFRFR